MKITTTTKVSKSHDSFRIFRVFCGKKYYMKGGIQCHEETELVLMEWDQ